MNRQKYNIHQPLLEHVLAWVSSGDIAIPEIQRPFVWDSSKVRDLLDSLLQGFPVGYLIAWRNQKVKLKNGGSSEGKRILIDGQQRVTALTAAVLGQEVVNKNYQRVRIRIAFNPQESRFEVLNPAIEKDVAWISDIATVFDGSRSIFKLVADYLAANPSAKPDLVQTALVELTQLTKKQIGLIELESDLDIETVTEIFIRINSSGVVLSQADFVMSKIAASDAYDGPMLRKAIDYFCHAAVDPSFVRQIQQHDKPFASSQFFSGVQWLKDENDDLYDPSYSDLLRVAFTSRFERGRLSELVSLLSGRNFETRVFEEEIAEYSFAKLRSGVLDFLNESHFKRFLMILKSAGFISSSLIRSQNAVNFSYSLYLKLREQKVEQALIESFVRRWFVLSVLTGRYSGSPESAFDYDIKQVAQGDFAGFLSRTEQAELSSAFWEVGLVQALDTSSSGSPYFNVFIAAQIKAADKGFLSRDITVGQMVEQQGDIHHLFPRDYLKKLGYTRGQYNQIANYVYLQTEINIRVGNRPPKAYMAEVLAQCNGGPLRYGAITDKNLLAENMGMHCIPEQFSTMEAGDYENFLSARRLLMASKMHAYYKTL